MLPTAIFPLPGAILVASIVFACIAVVAVFLLYAINTPLRQLARAANRYGHGQPVVLPERGPSEIVEVESAFNAMQSRIQRLISDRTQALVAVSHDLRTPIARLRLRCELLGDKPLKAEFERDLLEMEAMVDSTLAYLRDDNDAEPRRPTDVASMLSTIVDAAVDSGHDARLSSPQHAVVTVRGLSIKRALANLIDNAVTYGSSARVSVEQNINEIRIVIDDDGPGVPEADIQHIFEPFHRLDTSRGTGGVGLGLTIARQAVEREGGCIQLCNRADGGLRAEIRLPLRSPDGKPATLFGPI
jgi:signal transduction histidine kinase